MDGDLNVRPATCLLTRAGTTVTLSRKAAFASAAEFCAHLEGKLREYCQYLRRNDRKGAMLPVWFAGRNLTRPMSLPGPLSCRFRSGTVEGAVGLAEKPRVRLYARGLPVWQGALLSQMSHLQMDSEGQAEIGLGLAPEFLVNGNRLDVTFSRDLALENSALGTVRKKAEAALRRLLAAALERTFPRTRLQRFRDGLSAAWKRIRRPGWLWLPLLLLILVPLEISILRLGFPAGGATRASRLSLRAGALSYEGATVSFSVAAAVPPFSYQPEIPSWFRLFAADAYDIRSGFVRRPGVALSPAPQTGICRPEQSLRMSFPVDGGGEIFLPLPPGQVLQSGSLRLDGRKVGSIFSSLQGETIAVIAGGGVLEYRSCPAEPNQELTTAEFSRLTALPPGLVLPADLEERVRDSLFSPLAARVALARDLVRERLAYDISAPVARQYSLAGGDPGWLARALRIGKGDCDILNGLNVLLLRKMGVPSRLVVGMIGEQGRAGPLLHAWSEYFDRGWMVSDASAGLPVGANAMAAAKRAGSGSRPAMAAAAGKKEPRSGSPALAAAWLLLAMVAAAALWRAVKRKRAGAKPLPAAGQMKDQLLLLVRQALLKPEIWGRDNPLRSHRLLPTLDGRAMAVRQAQRLIPRRRLFLTSNGNPLAMAMMKSGFAVLDLGQPLYDPLRVFLAGAVDTDMLCRLRPQPPPLPGFGPPPDLLAAVSALLRKMPGKAGPCLLTPGLPNVDFLKIDLPAPLRGSPFFFPQRFIAVNPAGTTFRHMSSLYERNRPLAVFKFLQRLNADGLLDGCSGPARLKWAARRLLEADT